VAAGAIGDPLIKTLKDSSKWLIEDKVAEMGVGHLFEIMHDCIKTPGDGVIRFQGMQDSSVKDRKCCCAGQIEHRVPFALTTFDSPNCLSVCGYGDAWP
jgi:hypothetical protein